jgi:hypothetical protein
MNGFVLSDVTDPIEVVRWSESIDGSTGLTMSGVAHYLTVF